MRGGDDVNNRVLVVVDQQENQDLEEAIAAGRFREDL